MLALDTSTNSSRTETRNQTHLERERVLFENEELIKMLRARIAELEALLAEAPKEEVSAYPDDTPEKVQKLLTEAYAENNVDWLVDSDRLC